MFAAMFVASVEMTIPNIARLTMILFSNLPGFLLQIKVVAPGSFPNWIADLYHYAWFVGFFVSGISYLLLMKPAADRREENVESNPVIQHSTLNIQNKI